MYNFKEKIMTRLLCVAMIATCAFFGCFLAFYNKNPMEGGKPVQANEIGYVEDPYWEGRQSVDFFWTTDMGAESRYDQALNQEIYPKVIDTYYNHVASEDSYGNGSAGNPYLIWTAEQLALFLQGPEVLMGAASGFTGQDLLEANNSDYPNLYLSLCANIDVSARGWYGARFPEGIESITIYGNGYVINGLNGSGLFGYSCTGNITVENLYLSNVSTGANLGYGDSPVYELYTGAFVGQCTNFTADGCGVSGIMNLTTQDAKVTVEESEELGMGGFVGSVSGDCTITECFSYMDIYLNASPIYIPIGGFVGRCYGNLEIISSYVNAAIELNDAFNNDVYILDDERYSIGGLVGRTAGCNIYGCYYAYLGGAFNNPIMVGGFAGNPYSDRDVVSADASFVFFSEWMNSELVVDPIGFGDSSNFTGCYYSAKSWQMNGYGVAGNGADEFTYDDDFFNNGAYPGSFESTGSWWTDTSMLDADRDKYFFPLLQTSLVGYNYSMSNYQYANDDLNFDYTTPFGEEIYLPNRYEGKSLTRAVKNGIPRVTLLETQDFNGQVTAVKGTNMIFENLYMPQKYSIYAAYEPFIESIDEHFVQSTELFSPDDYENYDFTTGRTIIWAAGSQGDPVDIFLTTETSPTISSKIHVCLKNFGSDSYALDPATFDFGVDVSYKDPSTGQVSTERITSSPSATMQTTKDYGFGFLLSPSKGSYQYRITGIEETFNKNFAGTLSGGDLELIPTKADVYVYIREISWAQINGTGYIGNIAYFAQTYVDKPSGNESAAGSFSYIGANGEEKSINIVDIGTDRYAKVKNGSTSITLTVSDGTSHTISANQDVYFRFIPISWMPIKNPSFVGQDVTNLTVISRDILFISAFNKTIYPNDTPAGESLSSTYLLSGALNKVASVMKSGTQSYAQHAELCMTQYSHAYQKYGGSSSQEMIAPDLASPVSSYLHLDALTLREERNLNLQARFTDFAAFIYAMENKLSKIDSKMPAPYWAGALDDTGYIRGQYGHAITINEAGASSLTKLNIVSGVRPCCTLNKVSYVQ